MRPVYDLVQRLGRTRAGKAMGSRAYRALARRGAELLVELPGVDSVYGTGSLASHWLQPGYSDIDLVLLIDVDGPDSELALRRRLRAVRHRYRAFGRLFRDIDFIEVRDLEWFRLYPDAWALDFDQRWTWLAGPDRLEPARAASLPSEIRRLAWAIKLLRRWMKASSFLLDPTSGRPAFVEVRGARRLLGQAASAYLDRHPNLPLDELVPASAERLGAASDCREIERSGALRSGSREVVPVLLAGVLELLETVLDESFRTGPDGWSAAQSAAPPAIDAVTERVASSALDHGFRSVVLAPRHVDEAMLFVLPTAGTRRERIDRLRELLRKTGHLGAPAFRWSPRPMMATESIWRAAALFDPHPFVGEAIATRSTVQWGSPPELPSAVAVAQWQWVLRSRALCEFHRVRSRDFRIGKSPGAAKRELELARRYDRFTDLPREPHPGPEELLAAHQRWMADWRPILESGPAVPENPKGFGNRPPSS